MPALSTFADALERLQALRDRIPADLRPELNDILVRLEAGAERSRLDGEQLAAAQAEALVTSALLVSELETAREELGDIQAANRQQPVSNFDTALTGGSSIGIAGFLGGY